MRFSPGLCPFSLFTPPILAQPCDEWRSLGAGMNNHVYALTVYDGD